jgi:tetratricopeptide (TPR) repeat protein
LDENSLAIKDFTKAIELNPNNSLAYRYRGAAYVRLGNYRQALEDWKEGARLGDEIAKDELAKLNQKEGNTLRLICEGGGFKRLWVVNLAEKTANGFPANITENSIDWTNSSGIRISIDRYTGQVTATDNQGTVPIGKCFKASEKQF